MYAKFRRIDLIFRLSRVTTSEKTRFLRLSDKGYNLG